MSQELVAAEDLMTLSPRELELLQMLRYMRPSFSVTEVMFAEKYLIPLGVQPDEAGNLWLEVGEGSRILWSSHIDTVHKQEGVQRILYGAGMASAHKSSCLGADCTVGVWLMMHMIKAGVHGTYIFHVGEEVGGTGSKHIATKTPERLSQFDFAIAFDRKGTDEIITHQMMDRCASEAFAESLGNLLYPLEYSASDGGTFTDTANYASIIPECTNISVGYYKQHQSAEYLDVKHACRLLDRLVAIDWSGLVCARDPTALNEEDRYRPASLWEPESMYSGFADYIRRNAVDVADFLMAYGIGTKEIENYIWEGIEEDDRNRANG